MASLSLGAVQLHHVMSQLALLVVTLRNIIAKLSDGLLELNLVVLQSLIELDKFLFQLGIDAVDFLLHSNVLVTAGLTKLFNARLLLRESILELDLVVLQILL